MNTFKIIVLAILMMITASAANAQMSKTKSLRPTGLNAYQKDNRLYFDWTADSTSKIYFEVQKSDDGENFKTVALVMGADPRKAADQFGYMEKIKQNDKAVYFRLKQIDEMGNEELSEAVQLKK